MAKSYKDISKPLNDRKLDIETLLAVVSVAVFGAIVIATNGTLATNYHSFVGAVASLSAGHISLAPQVGRINFQLPFGGTFSLPNSFQPTNAFGGGNFSLSLDGSFGGFPGVDSGSLPFMTHGLSPVGRPLSSLDLGFLALAVPFYLVGGVFMEPVLFGALASIAIFFAARRWIGRWGGAIAVTLFLSINTAITLSERISYAASIDSSLIAIGASLILLTLINQDQGPSRHLLIGGVGLFSLVLATLLQSSNVWFLVGGVALLTIYRTSARIGTSTLVELYVVALGSLASVILFNEWALRSISNGGIFPFSVAAIGGNISAMLPHGSYLIPELLAAVGGLLYVFMRHLLGGWCFSRPSKPSSTVSEKQGSILGIESSKGADRYPRVDPNSWLILR